MTSKILYRYARRGILIQAPNFPRSSAEFSVSVSDAPDHGDVDEFSATLSVWSGAAFLQVYPTVTQLDALIEALQGARQALSTRIAQQFEPTAELAGDPA